MVLLLHEERASQIQIARVVPSDTGADGSDPMSTVTKTIETSLSMTANLQAGPSSFPRASPSF